MQENNKEISLLKARIIQYIDYKGISKYEFYKKTGISHGILSQNNGLSEENLLKTFDYFGEINPIWLITGKGEMELIDVKEEKKAEKEIVTACANCEVLRNYIKVLEDKLAALENQKTEYGKAG